MVSAYYEPLKRLCDIAAALVGLALLGPAMLVIALLIRLSSPGPALHWSKRVGRHNRIFRMAKFRSMRNDTPQVATHLLDNPDQFVTTIGRFLRKHSLDELPQLLNILKGDISVVGPRPALFNQDDLVRLRTEQGVHTLPPGLTGWAQVNGRDELPIPTKVDYDTYYLHHRSLWFDLKIILRTAAQTIQGAGVSH